MKNEIEAMITDITATTAEAEDYTGEDGLLYCGKCHTPKEAYFSKETAQWLGHDRHPTECDCERAAREKREAAESRQKHLETVEDLKRRGFTDPAMRNWTFEHDNGKNPADRNRPFLCGELGKPCRLKISATCSGAAWGQEKATLPPVSPTPLWRKRLPSA